MPHLMISSAKGGDKRLDLRRQEYVFGRDPSVSIPLQDGKVSRQHARLFREGDDFWLEDLGSANGVMVLGQRIAEPVLLEDGVEFEIGTFHMVFYDERQASRAQTFSLIGCSAPCEGQAYILPQGEIDVGRGEENAIVIVHNSISRQHAVVEVTPDTLTVQDLESRNGVFVDGVRVERRELAAGNRVRFGSVEFEVAVEAQGAGKVVAPLSGLLRKWRSADSPTRINLALGAVAIVLSLLIVYVLVRGPVAPNPSDGRAEAEYEHNIRKGLAAAKDRMQHESWEDAINIFSQVLELDPANGKAREGRMEAEANRNHQRTLEQGRQAMADGLAEEVVRLVGKIPASGHYGPAAAALAQQARGVIAGKALLVAREACRGKDWKHCHEQAIIVLKNQPDSAPGRGFVTEAENAMRSRNIAFTPWSPPRVAAPKTPDQPDAPPEKSIDELYPDAAVREAVMRYASGDIESAIQSARVLGRRPGGASLSSQLGDLKRSKSAGDGASMAGSSKRAIEAWQEALEIDAKLLPHSHVSVVRNNLGAAIAKETKREGESAFERGDYVEAFAQWSVGLRYDPQNTDLLTALAKLELQAKQILSDIQDPPRGNDCEQLRTILTMSRPESQAHTLAKTRLAACP